MDKIIIEHQRRQFDTWYYNQVGLIDKIVSARFSNSSFYYIHFGFITQKSIELYKQDKNPVIVIMTLDRFVWDESYGTLTGEQILNQLSNIDKTFIILTQMDYVEKNLIIPTNVHFVTLACAMLLEQDQYPLIQPTCIKNFNSPRHFISLNRGFRLHRMLAAMICLGHELGYDENKKPATGLLRISNSPLENCATIDDFYPGINVTTYQRNILNLGFQRVKDQLHGGQPDGNYPINPENVVGFNNSKNFDESLRKLYTNSFVEIVNETIYYSRSVLPSEKTLNSIYGFNLPIFISSPGFVAYLESLGFDMMRDLINHDYDIIDDPVERVFAAIELNLQLLKDRNYAISQWKLAYTRLESNYNFAREEMYDRATHTFKQKLIECVSRL